MHVEPSSNPYDLGRSIRTTVGCVTKPSSDASDCNDCRRTEFSVEGCSQQVVILRPGIVALVTLKDPAGQLSQPLPHVKCSEPHLYCHIKSLLLLSSPTSTMSSDGGLTLEDLLLMVPDLLSSNLLQHFDSEEEGIKLLRLVSKNLGRLADKARQTGKVYLGHMSGRATDEINEVARLRILACAQLQNLVVITTVFEGENICQQTCFVQVELRNEIVLNCNLIRTCSTTKVQCASHSPTLSCSNTLHYCEHVRC